MNQPSVCAVMVTADRPEFVKKAVECFLKQSYESARLLIFDSSLSCEPILHPKIAYARAPRLRGSAIGFLRNTANEMVTADVIVHWDDDDWSHPNRIAEQVDLLAATGADVVGYNEMLFWRTAPLSAQYPDGADVPPREQAWLYRHHRVNYALGTSLCYWRKTWDAKPFKAELGRAGGTGEDHDWIQGLGVIAATAVPGLTEENEQPRMIARIHGANTSGQYQNLEGSDSWKRVPEWDARVREMLA